ncbi:MAG: peptidoglycan recognition protein [Actinobacteria bacterium]|nr:peptidoglycan recognition protein [Actinomycetota bacterium]
MVPRWLKIAPALCVAGAVFFVTPACANAGGVAEFERTIRLTAPDGRSGRANSAAGGGASSALLRTGRSFNLVGFRWRGSAPQIEVQSYGTAGWSRWTRVETDAEDLPDDGPLTHEGGARAVSGPIWTGRSNGLRVRVRGTAAGLTAHFVNVSIGAASGGVSSADLVRAGSGGKPSAGVTSAAADGSGGVGPGGSPAADTQSGAGGGSGGGKSKGTSNTGRGADVPAAPAIVTRSQWGADRNCKPRVTPSFGEVLATLVHHTVSTNSYTREEAASVVLGICRYHRNSNGWNDVGYNLLIDRFGTVYEGRSGGVDRAVIGAHAQGYNGQTAGIALVGTFTGSAPPTEALNSLQQVLNWKLALSGITRNERVALISTGGSLNRFKEGRTVFVRPVGGHRDVGATSCPGNGMYTLIPGLAGQLDPNVRTATRLSMRLKRVQAEDRGHSVIVSGRLLAKGAPVADQAVEIQALDLSVGWIKIADTRSDGNGFWQATIRPTSRQWVRGAFTGGDTMRPGRSIWRYTPKLAPPPVSGTRRR